MDLPRIVQTSLCGLPLTVSQSAPLSSFQPPPAPVVELSRPDPPVAQQVQTSQPGLEIATPIWLSGSDLSEADERTLLDYVGSSIRDSTKKFSQLIGEDLRYFVRLETCQFCLLHRQ